MRIDARLKNPNECKRRYVKMKKTKGSKEIRKTLFKIALSALVVISLFVLASCEGGGGGETA